MNTTYDETTAEADYSAELLHTGDHPLDNFLRCFFEHADSPRPGCFHC